MDQSRRREFIVQEISLVLQKYRTLPTRKLIFTLLEKNRAPEIPDSIYNATILDTKRSYPRSIRMNFVNGGKQPTREK